MEKSNQYRHTSEVDGSIAASRIVVPLLFDIVLPHIYPTSQILSVVDVGGGTGAWLRTFLDFGVSRGVLVDELSATGGLLVPKEFFKPHDLSRSMPNLQGFDLALCLECAEHLPEHQSQQLVECLTNAAPIVLFSGAIPGQPGIGHINCQYPEYWQRLFDRVGFERFDIIRPLILNRREIPSWYRQNLYLFCRRPMNLHASIEQFPDDFTLVSKAYFQRISNPSIRIILKRILPACLESIKYHLLLKRNG